MDNAYRIRIIPLICPACGKPVPAGGNDVLFYCAGCDAAWEIEGEGLTRRELRHLDGEGGIRLPFWVIPFRLVTRGVAVDTVNDYLKLSGGGIGSLVMVGDGAEAICANRNLLHAIAAENRGNRLDPPRLYVPAGPLHTTPQHIQAGRLLTARQPVFATVEHVGEPLSPIVFCEEDARRMGDVILLATVARERDRSSGFLESLTCTLKKGMLCSIPFVARGTKFFHAGLNLEF